MENLNSIIIDTSTPQSLVAFSHGFDVLFKILLPPDGKSSRYLPQLINDGLKKVGWTPLDLQVVAVGTGPGSYTGLRVGAAVAKGLAFPRSLPLLGFCSLEGFISPHQGPFASLIDARMGGSYVLLQERIGDNIILHSQPRLIDHVNLSSYLDGWPVQAGPHLDYPNAEHLAKLITAKKSSINLELLYLRTPVYQKNLRCPC